MSASRDQANRLLVAALVRPVNLVAPVAGLLFALLGAPWWIFPLAIAAYAVMVVLTVRDPKFIARALGRDGAAAPPRTTVKGAAVTTPVLVHALARIEVSEAQMDAQVEAASPSLRPVLEATREQVRSAAALGAELARKVEDLDRALADLDVGRARARAAERRQLAEAATDAGGRRELLDAATTLEESAGHAESLAALRQRTVAQLDHLAVSLENAVVRAVRIRVASDDDEGARALSTALRADVENLRETLAAFEEPAPRAPHTPRTARREDP